MRTEAGSVKVGGTDMVQAINYRWYRWCTTTGSRQLEHGPAMSNGFYYEGHKATPWSGFRMT